MFGYTLVKTSELSDLKAKLDKYTKGLRMGTAASAARRKASAKGEA